MKLGKAGFQLAQSFQGFQVMMFFANIALWILGWHAISVNVFTRKGFGCRYLSRINLFFGLAAIGLYTGIGNLALSAATHQRFSVLMELLYFVFIALSVYHGIQVWLSRKRNRMPHTMYSGKSLLEFTGLDEGVVKRWIEPGLLFVLGYAAAHMHQTPVATWLYIGAFSVFVHETLSEYMSEARILDQYDAMIEAGYNTDIVGGRSPENRGFSMSQAAVTMIHRNPDLATGLNTLPDDMRNILDREVAA